MDLREALSHVMLTPRAAWAPPTNYLRGQLLSLPVPQFPPLRMRFKAVLMWSWACPA